MDRIIRRNRTMYKLSIIALVMYVLYIGYTFLIGTFGFEMDQLMLHRVISGTFASVVLLIGFVAVYVLWTPDNEGNVRKRPTWLFTLLLVAIFIPKIQSLLYNLAEIEWGTMMVRVASYSIGNSSGSMQRTIALTDLLIPLGWAMIIILLIKCERKAKKIMIVYTIVCFLSVVFFITQILIFKTGELNAFNDIFYGYIYPFYSCGINLLLLIFTIIYTRSKVKGVISGSAGDLDIKHVQTNEIIEEMSHIYK